jgi:integrase
MTAVLRRRVNVSATERPDPLIGALDIDMLIRLGWDPATRVFSPDPAHPLLGYAVCQVLGCGAEAGDKRGICTGCLFRSKATPDVDLEAFCASGIHRGHRSQPDLCAVCCVPGFERPATANGLCFACDGQRRKRGQTTSAYLNGDEVFSPAAPRPGLGSCAVWACQRVAARPSTKLCGAHDVAWRNAGRPELAAFCRCAAPCLGDRGGQVVLAGLSERVIRELLYGIQASVGEGRQVMIQVLRPAATLLRRCEIDSVADFDTAGGRDPVRWFLRFTADRATLARACPETERAKDVWDLRVWGAGGQLSFVGGGVCHRSGSDPTRPITQPWLKEAAKAWAADALIRMTTGPVRAVVAAVGLWSEHLGRRADGGVDPSVLAHRDIEAFLARLGHLNQAGKLSASRRDRTIHLVAKFLRECREMGLAQPGRELAALAGDVVIRAAERPATTRRDDEIGKALPEAVIAQLLSPDSLTLLEQLAGATLRAAVELGVGVGRRTAELCSLAFDCVDYDEHADASGEPGRRPVLVHDMPKVDKFGCRLPIHDREVAIISAQQARVRAEFPATPTDLLALFPRPLKNPDGTHPLGTAHLQRAMHLWVQALPRLDAPERDAAGRPIPFPRDSVTPYAFRHSFAQRHADAGTPLDALKDLLGHDTVRTTLGYYRVTTKRKRDAQDRLGPLQVDRAGRLVRPSINGLADAERLGDDIGQVAVPFGICTEPTNVAADGHSCPFRHRCTGCEYFRTDPSFQPELRAYLTQLLADRERLATAVPQLAEWARREATPSAHEIDAVRRLVRANDEAIAALDQQDRDAIQEAITTIRKHRATLNVTFPVELRGVVSQPAPHLFPTIEADARANGTHD